MLEGILTMNEMKTVPDEDLRLATRADIRPGDEEGFASVEFNRTLFQTVEVLAAGKMRYTRLIDHLERWRKLRD